MAELKTKENKASVKEFINSLKDKDKIRDSLELLEIFKQATKEKPKMWGTSIIGFGKYHYKSKKSTQEGDWFNAGFSPRKGMFSLYIMSGFEKHEILLKKLGKFKKSSGCCLYIKKIEDIDKSILKKIIEESIKNIKYK